MRQTTCGFLALAVLLGGAALFNSAAQGAEPYREFVEGLREKQLFDYALFYLEQIEKDPRLPDEIKQTLDFEKAETLLQGANQIKSAEEQTKQLDRAEAFLEQFTKAYPNHAMAGKANTSRANILLNKARVEMIQAKSSANAGNQEPFRVKARELVGKARTIFQAAHDQHKAAWEKFPPFIDEKNDEELFNQRRIAEMNYIKAQLDLALSTYEEAQTYDVKSAEYKAILTKASTEFETMHQKYRSQVGGLFARMWQGKCFEEQEDLGKALGIYNELLEHPGGSSTMDRLQNQVLQFRLICLNHEQKRDYELVINEANKWLAEHKSLARTMVGLGIRWEKARAEEAMGNKRDLGVAESERYYKAALVDANEVNKYPGQYKDVSTMMRQRLNAALNKKDGDPKDFDSALGLGRSMVKQIKEMQDKITGARRTNKPKEEVAALQAELDKHLNETARMLRLGITLADDSVETAQLNTCRHLLAYIYYNQRRSYDAAILGEFIAARYPALDSQMALDSAYMAMAAWQQAYNSVKKGESRDVEIAQMIRVCNVIAKNWPASDRANEARMNLGQLYSQQSKPAEAAVWYGQVPESSNEYADAQLAAGQAYWTAYLMSAIQPEAERPAKEELDKWDAAAEKHLQVGIDKTSAGIPMEAIAPDPMIAGKASLAQIKINRGQYADAIKLILGDPHPILTAIQLKEGEARPATGVKSQPFAVLTFSLLLRCYVGTQEIDKALDAMGKLEAIAAADKDASVANIYVELGRELEKEIERIKGLGDQKRLSDLQTSYDKFLGEVYKRKDSMTNSSLVWIAEAYYGLGKGLDENPQVALEYFKKASSTYVDVITKVEAGATEDDKAFAAGNRLLGAKLRLVECRRREGNFDEAVNYLATVLKALPNSLEPQQAAARTYQDWGATGQADSQKRFLEAIDGPADGPLKDMVWGWKGLAFRLQKAIDSGKSTPDQVLAFLDARYNGTVSRFQYAKAQSSTSKRDEELTKAFYEVDTLVSVIDDIPEDWWTRFDTLYQDVQKELKPGTTPVALKKPEVIVTKTAEEEDKPDEAGSNTPVSAVPPTTPVAAAPAESGSPILVGIVLVLALAGTGAMIYFMMKPKKRRVRIATADDAPTFAPPAAAERPSRPKPAAAGAAKSAGTAAAPRPAAARPANGAAPAKPAAKAQPAAKPQPGAARPAGPKSPS